MGQPGQVGSQAPRPDDWIPRKIRELEDKISLLSSGSIPTAAIARTSATGWQATNNATLAALSIPWPLGKSKVDVISQVQGLFVAGGNLNAADVPVFRVGVAGQNSWGLNATPDQPDKKYWLNGFWHVRITTVAPLLNVVVYTTTGANVSAADPSNRVDLGVLAVFS